jgi:hypothetical protein
LLCNFTSSLKIIYLPSIHLFLYLVVVNNCTDLDSFFNKNLNCYNTSDNYYESLFNDSSNELFGFTLSYYLINAVEFILIGFLLLVGSVVCVNLYNINKNTRIQPYNNFMKIFSVFTNFVNFIFLKKQNLTKQSSIKASLQLFLGK